MKRYRVTLHGKNFLLAFDGKERMHGFITTRWVKAENPEDAEIAAVSLVKEDKSLIDCTLNKNGNEQTPMIYLDEIAEVSWFTYIRKNPGSGYTFYENED